jgi:CubicO group peptidase (beta-lactamase class C family)
METETTQPAPAPAGSRDRFAAVYRVLEDGIDQRAFPGCAFGVLAGGEVVLQDALGRHTYDDGAPEVTAETIWDVASVTKVAATTAAAMLLNQRGLLELDMPVGELLPGFIVGRAPGQHARHVKIRHLLAHSSGLPGYAPLYQTAKTPAALLRACLELPLEAEPGQRAEYSDIGFILLGKALEVITREYLATWVRREVFVPLGMASSVFCPPVAARPFIPPTEEDTVWRKRRIQGEVQDEHACLLKGAGGHAGLFSNVPDLLKFSRALREAGARGSGVFEAETVGRFAERQGPEGSSRALGWDTPSPESTSGRCFSQNSIGHLGFSGCSLWIDRDAKVAVVLLSNRTWPDRQTRKIREVWPRFHDAVREAFRGDSRTTVSGCLI